MKLRRGIDELLIEPCCAVKYYPEMETCENEIFMEEDENREEEGQSEKPKQALLHYSIHLFYAEAKIPQSLYGKG